MNLLIIVVAFGFIAISKSILIASGKIPQPKPMSLKKRICLYLVVFLFLLLNIAFFYFAMYADGKLDPDFLF